MADLSHGVVSVVMSKCKGEIYESVSNGGSMFLLYEIMMQSLVASESVLEFTARTIDYFKSQVILMCDGGDGFGGVGGTVVLVLYAAWQDVKWLEFDVWCGVLLAAAQIYKRLTNNAKKNFFRENAT